MDFSLELRRHLEYAATDDVRLADGVAFRTVAETGRSVCCARLERVSQSAHLAVALVEDSLGVAFAVLTWDEREGPVRLLDERYETLEALMADHLEGYNDCVMSMLSDRLAELAARADSSDDD